jgi:hypothetical protein
MKHVGGQSSRSVILNSGFRWMEMSGQLNDQEDLRRGKVPRYPININLLWPRPRTFGEEKDLYPYPGIEIRILGFSTRKLATTVTEIIRPRSFINLWLWSKIRLHSKIFECNEFIFSKYREGIYVLYVPLSAAVFQYYTGYWFSVASRYICCFF